MDDAPVSLEDRDWFREESRRKGALTSSALVVRPAPTLTRTLSGQEVAWACVAAAIQAALLVADQVGWLDVLLL